LSISRYAAIPGLVALQVEAALSDGTTGPGASVTYDAQSRSIGISLDGPQDVTVTAWWHTSFVLPEPKSTSRVILEEELPAGPYTIAIPDEVPAQASFATVSTGPSVYAFIVGPMPGGTTMARFPDPSDAQEAPADPALAGPLASGGSLCADRWSRTRCSRMAVTLRRRLPIWCMPRDLRRARGGRSEARPA
jgi:hypothetical protein